MSKIMENAKNRFKARIRAKIETKTINGTFKSIKTFYCNGIIFGKTKCYFFGKNGKRYQFLNSSIVSVDQCTGLKDKNSKPIYEGDVVVFYFDNDEIVGVISWSSDYQVGFYVNTTDYFKDKYITDYELLYGENYEVIGNKYENEELLND